MFETAILPAVYTDALLPPPPPLSASLTADPQPPSTQGWQKSRARQSQQPGKLLFSGTAAGGHRLSVCVCAVSSCFLMTCWQCSAVFLSPDDGSLTDSHCHSISTAGLCQLWDHATQQPINCFELNASANQQVRLSWVTFNRANRVWGLLFSDVVLLEVCVWFNRRT